MPMPPPRLTEAHRCLGVAPGADPVTIRRAWRALVRAHHPDHAPGDKAMATHRLAEINAAYDLISTWTPQQRRMDAPFRPTASRTRANATRQTTARADQASARADTARSDTARSDTARKAAEDQARARAAELDRLDAARRAARRRAQSAAAAMRQTARMRQNLRTRDLFHAALAAVSQKPATRTLARL